MTIKQIIETTLSIPVQEGIDVNLMPKCASLDIYQSSAGLAGDGWEEEPINYVQIDLFYKDVSQSTIVNAASTLKAAIKRSLQCSIPIIEYQYINDNRYWRATLTFQTNKE